MQSRSPTSTGLFSPSANAAILAATIVSALYFGRSVFIPLALAVLLSFVLSPLVVLLRRVRVPRGAAVATVVVLFVAAIGLLGMAMARQVTELANDLPRYESTLREKLKSLRTGVAQSGIVDRATETLKQLGKELDQKPGDTTGRSTGTTSVGDGPQPIPVEIHQPPERPLDTYQRIMAVLLAPLTTTGVVLILVIFILLQREDIRDRVISLVGARDIELTTAALNDAAFRLSRLFLAQTGMNAAYGAVIAIGLWTIGVPSPLLWGIIAALMRFIPYIGGIFSAVFPILLAAAVDPGWTMVFWTLALFFVVEPLVGQLIEPMVQGQTTGLSPLAVVVSAVLWTALWGPIGLLLATPLTMCLVVLGRHVEGLAFLHTILGDQPALSPPEIFYQRLAAGSSAEAADQAERELKTVPLLDYYDSVALPGLKLASLDANRGTIDAERMAELHDGVMVLLDDLSDQPVDQPAELSGEHNEPDAGSDADQPKPTVIPVLQDSDLAPGWSGEPAPVLCLGARSPLDTAAAEILAQLIRRHGVRAAVASTSRLAELARLDLSRVKLVWISSMDAAQSHAHIRFIIRRLRRSAAPDLVIAGGFWGSPGTSASAESTAINLQAHDLTNAVRMTVTLAGALHESDASQVSDVQAGTGRQLRVLPAG